MINKSIQTAIAGGLIGAMSLTSGCLEQPHEDLRFVQPLTEMSTAAIKGSKLSGYCSLIKLGVAEGLELLRIQ